ncbi:hypothetical protein KA344_21100 [bacterium]|jgi:hypothetical protein|nr:hypothetical protein [bacterium]
MSRLTAKHKLELLSVACLILLSSTAPALAQHSTQQLEQMLDSVENSSGYSAASQLGNGGQYQAAPFNQSPVMQHPFMNQGNSNWQSSRSVPQMAPNQTIQSMQGTNQSPFAKINRARQWMNGSEQQQQPAQQQPRSGRPGIFQTMFGDSADSSSGDARGNASRAQTQAGVARNAASSSYYGDHYSRSQNADTAYYAAAAARREADAAYYKAQSPNADAATRSYYATARAAADSAQAAADTARLNADRTYK